MMWTPRKTQCIEANIWSVIQCTLISTQFQQTSQTSIITCLFLLSLWHVYFDCFNLHLPIKVFLTLYHAFFMNGYTSFSVAVSCDCCILRKCCLGRRLSYSSPVVVFCFPVVVVVVVVVLFNVGACAFGIYFSQSLFLLSRFSLVWMAFNNNTLFLVSLQNFRSCTVFTVYRCGVPSTL